MTQAIFVALVVTITSTPSDHRCHSSSCLGRGMSTRGCPSGTKPGGLRPGSQARPVRLYRHAAEGTAAVGRARRDSRGARGPTSVRDSDGASPRARRRRRHGLIHLGRGVRPKPAKSWWCERCVKKIELKKTAHTPAWQCTPQHTVTFAAQARAAAGAPPRLATSGTWPVFKDLMGRSSFNSERDVQNVGG